MDEHTWQTISTSDSRSTRRVSPTDAGQAYYARCSPILLELEAADRDVVALHETPRGTLRINAPMSFGTAYIGPAVADFMKEYRELRVELTLNDRFVDPIEEGFDVTVRIGELADSSVNFLVRPWAKAEDYWGLYWDTTETVKLKFDEAGISIPFPQMDVHVDKPGD